MAGTNYPAKFYHRHPRGYYFPWNIELCFYPSPLSPTSPPSSTPSFFLFHAVAHPPVGRFVATPSIVVEHSRSTEEVFEKPTGKLKVRRVTRSRWQPPFFPILLPILTTLLFLNLEAPFVNVRPSPYRNISLTMELFAGSKALKETRDGGRVIGSRWPTAKYNRIINWYRLIIYNGRTFDRSARLVID